MRSILALAACLIATVAYAEAPDPPPFYAIVGVTIVSADEGPIEGATVEVTHAATGLLDDQTGS